MTNVLENNFNAKVFHVGPKLIKPVLALRCMSCCWYVPLS